MSVTSDWSDADFARYIEICRELSCEPLHLMKVMWVEGSKPGLGGCYADAMNPHSSATGLIQWMKPHYERWGYTRDQFARLGVSGQLPYLLPYFMPHRGKLTTAARIYTAVFLPADIDHSADPEFILSKKGGRRDWAFAPNRIFDRNKDGAIQVRELDETIAAQIAGARGVAQARWKELMRRLAEADYEIEGPLPAA